MASPRESALIRGLVLSPERESEGDSDATLPHASPGSGTGSGGLAHPASASVESESEFDSDATVTHASPTGTAWRSLAQPRASARESETHLSFRGFSRDARARARAQLGALHAQSTLPIRALGTRARSGTLGYDETNVTASFEGSADETDFDSDATVPHASPAGAFALARGQATSEGESDFDSDATAPHASPGHLPASLSARARARARARAQPASRVA